MTVPSLSVRGAGLLAQIRRDNLSQEPNTYGWQSCLFLYKIDAKQLIWTREGKGEIIHACIA
jgi:hypothetical protein